MLKKIFLLLFIITFTMNAKDKVFPYDYEQVKLENGLTVILIPMNSPGLASYYSIVRTGSRDEVEPGKTGFAHFFEHMMFRGSEKYPGPVRDSIVTSLGADGNAYTTDDRTVYYLSFASEDLEKIMELESDRFQFLSYAEQDFQTEAGAVYGEYRKNVTNPWSVLFETLHNTAFDKHTYKHTTMGFVEDIKMMPQQYEFSKKFFNMFYRPDNIVLLIVGDIDKGNTLELVNKYYGNWKSGYVKPDIPIEPKQKGLREKEVSFAGRTLPLMIIAHKGDAFDISNKDIFAASLFEDLAFGETSIIYKKLVLDEQKVQFVSADFGYNRDPGLLNIYSMIKNENDIDYVKNEIINTLNKYKNELVDSKKLADLKKRIKYSFLMNLDSPSSVASALPTYLTYVPDLSIIDEMFSVIETITPEDIKNAANKYFDESQRTIVTLKGGR